MKNNLKFILLGISIVALITAIIFYFRINTYQVNFYSDGQIYQSIETRRNRQMKEPNTPIKEGFIFIGWYDEEGNVFDFEQNITKNMNLIAHWGEIVKENAD